MLHSIDPLVEFAMTLWVQTGNERDVTMQAGKQRAVLPLIRKFNEHSSRLLNTVLYVTFHSRFFWGISDMPR